MRRGLLNKRRDSNEPAIIDALRAVGATVEQLSLADGPDLLVGFRFANWLLEVKTPKGKLSDGQKCWQGEWCGRVVVVRSPDDALQAIGVKAYRREAR